MYVKRVYVCFECVLGKCTHLKNTEGANPNATRIHSTHFCNALALSLSLSLSNHHCYY